MELLDVVRTIYALRLRISNLRSWIPTGRAQQPLFPFLRGLVTLQPALGFVWNRSPTHRLLRKSEFFV